jgi:nitrite reductase (NO-forming)
MKAIGCALAIVGLIAIVVVATLGGARLNGSGSGSSGSAEIVLEDLRFVPNRIDAKVGVPITVRLTNKGTERHDLNFESLHMPGLGGVESILEPGETRTITLTFDQPGTHTFICTLPGHAAAGMTGAAFVSP